MQPEATLSRDQIVYCFDAAAEPRLTIAAPATLLFETHDARGGRLKRPEQVHETAPDFNDRFPKANPATGPVRVEGAEPGDTITIDIHAIDLDRQGFILVKPDMGLVRDLTAEPLASICTVEDGHVRLGDLRFRLRPMVGVIAVAPAGEPWATAYVGRHGGNIDSSRMAVGTRLHLPVQVPGGLVYVGDVHAAMGDGEVSGAGVEIGARVLVTIGLEKGTGRTWPHAETADQLITIASAPTYELASEIAVREMMALLGERLGLSPTDAFMLISAIGDVRVNQACRSKIDTSVRVEMPKLGHGLERV
jgi:amidase